MGGEYMRYRWLHISDLHSICLGIRTAIMRDDLINEIRYLNQQSKFSFLLITGDISDKNKGYDEAAALIHKIIKAIDVPLDKVYIVPGNHDVDRNIPPDREELIKKGWQLDLLDGQEEDLISKLLLGQNQFFKTYEDILGRSYPLDKVHFNQELDENLSIIHLNTSWMCYDSENESGKLHIGLKNVRDCLSDSGLNEKAIKIAIGHHRISDFNKTVKGNLKSLFKSADIDLYLGGHCHESIAIYDPTINTEFCSCRQARAEDVNYPAGFVIGDINTEIDQSSFRFYNWDSERGQWTYDYTVDSAKHGKYYLQGEKFTKEPEGNRNVIVDFKLKGTSLNSELIMETFNIKNSAIYNLSMRDIRPKLNKEWKSYLKEIRNMYEEIIKYSNTNIHVFPLAPIPLLVAFGYLMQNDAQNIKIYQYYENKELWVLDEHDDKVKINENVDMNGNKRLAVALSISAEVKNEYISEVLIDKYDLLSVGIKNPGISKLNYRSDVIRAKMVVKSKLDSLYDKYEELHLFLAAPAGLCIEIGRIIRENMYPDTFIYNYESAAKPRYIKIFNLKKIHSI